MKKIVLSIFTLVVIAFGVVFSSCDTGSPFNNCRSRYYFEFDNPISFKLFDYYTGDNLLKIAYNRYYTQDSVKVYDDDWNVLFPGPVDNAGLVIFEFLNEEEDLGVINQISRKNLYLYLEHSDIDTIAIDFEMEIDDCGDQVMKYMKIQYNDSVYFDGETNSVPGFLFQKK